MSARVIALGGAAAWPNPGQGCSSFLVLTDRTTVLVDCGPDTLLELRKHVDYTTIDAIVITHGHSDHILDLVPYRYGLRYGPVQPQAPIPLWIPRPVEQVLTDLAAALGGQGEPPNGFWTSVFNVQTYDPAGKLEIGDLKVTFARTQHFAECYAVRFETAAGNSITYTSDTGSIAPVAAIARGTNLLIAEATFRDYGTGPESERGHITPEDAGRLAHEAEAGALLLTHLWSERTDGEVLVAASENFGGPIHIARPGESFHV